MGEMKRKLGGHLYRESKSKEVEEVNWSSETSTEAVYKGVWPLFDTLGYVFFRIIVRGQDNAIKCQWKAMSNKELDQAIKTVEDLRNGEKITYWTRGVNIHSPTEWFYKIERK